MPAPSPPHASTLSGDPLADRVILWTRITVPDAAAVVSGTWAVSTDPTLRKVVSSGSFTTDAGVDFTVNVDATGLQPGTTYYFRFLAQGGSSPIGRTRTAPTGGVSDRGAATTIWIRLATRGAATQNAGSSTRSVATPVLRSTPGIARPAAHRGDQVGKAPQAHEVSEARPLCGEGSRAA